MVGIDSEEIARFDGWDNKKIKRIFCEEELVYANQKINPSQTLCGCWCVKEAVVKALDNTGLEFKKIKVLHTPSGKPYVEINAYLRKFLAGVGCNQINVSITHTGAFATAIAILS